MSDKDNVSLVQDLYAAFRRRDINYILDRVTDDVQWEMEGPSSIPYAGIRRGKAEAAGFFRGLGEESDSVLTIDTIVASDGKVATFGRWPSTVRATGTRVNGPVAHLFEIRDGKVYRFLNLGNTAQLAEAHTKAVAVA